MHAQTPIVTAEKLLAYKKASGHIDNLRIPETVLVCYQRSTMQHLLGKYPQFQPSQAVSHFYTLDDCVGILGDWGVGAPGLAIKLEELVVLGAKKFIAVGTAGGLMYTHKIADFVFCPQALAEDGVAHLYLPPHQFVIEADQDLICAWADFTKEKSLPQFQPAMAWSFSALFRESVADVLRVSKLGCTVVEMEAATLYAIGREKNIKALSLFVISDSITEEAWIPRPKDQAVRDNLHYLAESSLEFCMSDICSSSSCF